MANREEYDTFRRQDTGGPMTPESMDSALDAAFGAVAAKNQMTADAQSRRLDALVDLRAEIIEAQNELSGLAHQQTPKTPRGFVEVEIRVAKLEQRIALLTEQYREALSAYVLADEGSE